MYINPYVNNSNKFNHLRPSEDEEILVSNGGDLIGGNKSRKTPGVILSLLSCCTIRFHSSPVPLYSQSSRHFPPSPQIPLAMASKVITLEDLREHTTKDDIWVLLHGKGQFLRKNCPCQSV